MGTIGGNKSRIEVVNDKNIQLQDVYQSIPSNTRKEIFGGPSQPTPAPGYMTRVYDPYSMTQALPFAMPTAPRLRNRVQEARQSSVGTSSGDSNESQG